MAQNLPALRGKFGSTEFFLITMKASEFVRTVMIPRDMEGWEQLSVEEKFQRDINYKRVKEKMAPYLATDPDRFFGAFIVTVKNHETMTFSSLNELNLLKNNVLLPDSFGTDLGVLILDGQMLIPLDGQHRLAALKMAITGKDEKDQEISDVPVSTDVGNDYVTAILVRDDIQKSRKIFNKVNRYAKPTSAADNLITSDDDGIAVICREHIVGAIIDSRIVKTSSGNTLTPSAKEFTTLNTIYKISKRLVEVETNTRVNTDQLPSPAELQIWRKSIVEFWEHLIELQPYRQSIIEPSDAMDQRRAEIRGRFLCCKPIVMEALAEAIFIMRYSSAEERPSLEKLVNHLDSINWDRDNDMWIGSLLQAGGERIIVGTTAMKFAARFIAYLIGWKPETKELEDLSHDHRMLTGGVADGNGKIIGGKDLPNPVTRS